MQRLVRVHSGDGLRQVAGAVVCLQGFHFALHAGVEPSLQRARGDDIGNDAEPRDRGGEADNIHRGQPERRRMQEVTQAHGANIPSTVWISSWSKPRSTLARRRLTCVSTMLVLGSK